MKVENPARLEQEEKAEEKRLAIMMMKKKEKYLYDKIMFGKKRKVREVSFNVLFFPIVQILQLIWLFSFVKKKHCSAFYLCLPYC